MYNSQGIPLKLTNFSGLIILNYIKTHLKVRKLFAKDPPSSQISSEGIWYRVTHKECNFSDDLKLLKSSEFQDRYDPCRSF